jgi:hypothetical protein
MNIREYIGKLKSESLVVVDEMYLVKYVQKLGKETGQRFKVRKQETGGWELFCQGKKLRNRRN